MTVDTPQAGLVIRHLYLWRDEARQGREEGLKARPCLIVDVRQNDYDETEVHIAPITHTPPKQSHQAKEIPLSTKQRLQLDEDRSWIVTTELNRFTWKGPDVRRTPDGRMAYGHLPPGLTKAVTEQIRENARARHLGRVDRDDQALNERLRKHREQMKNPGQDKDGER